MLGSLLINHLRVHRRHHLPCYYPPRGSFRHPPIHSLTHSPLWLVYKGDPEDCNFSPFSKVQGLEGQPCGSVEPITNYAWYPIPARPTVKDRPLSQFPVRTIEARLMHVLRPPSLVAFRAPMEVIQWLTACKVYSEQPKDEAKLVCYFLSKSRDTITSLKILVHASHKLLAAAY